MEIKRRVNNITTNADYYQLIEKRKAILAEMKVAEARLQELTTEMMECSLQIKIARESLEGKLNA